MRQLGLDNRNEFQRLLIDLDRELIQDPRLFAIYDTHPFASQFKDDPLLAAKLDAFGYMSINIFEMVYQFFHATGNLSTHERETWNSWESFFQHTVDNSSVIRKLLRRDDLDGYYPPKFAAYVRKALSKVAKCDVEDG